MTQSATVPVFRYQALNVTASCPGPSGNFFVCDATGNVSAILVPDTSPSDLNQAEMLAQMLENLRAALEQLSRLLVQLQSCVCAE